MIKNALILAAGKGTRMWPLSENTPKPLLPLGGLPIIERQIQELKKVGVENLYILIGYRMKEISDYLKGRELDVKITYIVQEQQKGTGHAVNQAKGKIKGSFYCLNGDIVINAENLERLGNNEDKLTMMVTKVADGSNFGVVESKNGYLVSIIEKGISGECVINAGIFLFNEKIFTAIDGIGKSIRGEYELTDALGSISDQIHIIEYQGQWKDIGNPWELITANEEYMNDKFENIEGIVEDYVTIKGNLNLGKGSILKSGTYIEGPVWIGENCVVGPNAYLRGGTVLCGKNKIGASTEVKNTIFLKGAKAPHHNYVGDSIIGEDTNLGSGTKIANLRFDKKTIELTHQGEKIDSGRRKLGAILGKNVKTGINASINAGSIIGNDVRIGPNTLVSGTYESKSTIA
jgi:UDP-N-acetylglucosamine diphosphorylase/glucosamine-1-phosphate N-acetyltransferase